MTEFSERLSKSKKLEARSKFSGYVQSVAFHMTLSRNMIEALQLVRDYGSPGGGLEVQNFASPAVRSYSVPLAHALEHRGLVWHDYIPPLHAPKGHRYHKLTRAGELMCDLLVEARLMPAAEKQARKKSA